MKIKLRINLLAIRYFMNRWTFDVKLSFKLALTVFYQAFSDLINYTVLYLDSAGSDHFALDCLRLPNDPHFSFCNVPLGAFEDLSPSCRKSRLQKSCFSFWYFWRHCEFLSTMYFIFHFVWCTLFLFQSALLSPQSVMLWVSQNIFSDIPRKQGDLCWPVSCY